jgi:hypothetical protein
LQFFEDREREVYAAFRRLTGCFLAAAAAGHTHPFWSDRLEFDEPERPPAEVQAAFERLRSREVLQVTAAPGLRVEDRPAVSGNEIVLEARLITTERPEGVRYVYDVDVLALVELAPRHASVPALFADYNRRHPPVALPEFLAALATALGRNWLRWV